MPPHDPAARAARLLLKALDSLSERERSEVLALLIERALVPVPVPVGTVCADTFSPGPRAETFTLGAARRSVATGLRPGHATLPADHRMFPVRLPERDHARLKQWCDNNGFPMAAVVRGLIERFLDERQPDGEAK
jgi:hypothetical protein